MCVFIKRKTHGHFFAFSENDHSLFLLGPWKEYFKEQALPFFPCVFFSFLLWKKIDENIFVWLLRDAYCLLWQVLLWSTSLMAHLQTHTQICERWNWSRILCPLRRRGRLLWWKLLREGSVFLLRIKLLLQLTWRMISLPQVSMVITGSHSPFIRLVESEYKTQLKKVFNILKNAKSRKRWSWG